MDDEEFEPNRSRLSDRDENIRRTIKTPNNSLNMELEYILLLSVSPLKCELLDSHIGDFSSVDISLLVNKN